MGRLFKFIFQTLLAVIIIFLFAGALISLDGTVDQGTQADVGLVLGGAPLAEDGGNPLLDRTVKLYKDDAFPMIIVSSTVSRPVEQPEAMAKYLEARGVPHDAIIVEKVAYTTPEIARSVTSTMTTRRLKSAIIVSDYYRIFLMKLALYHDGLKQIGKAHVGKVQPDDFPAIARETVDFYRYVSVAYLFPAAEKMREEAKAGTEQLKVDADKATKKADESLDSLAK